MSSPGKLARSDFNGLLPVAAFGIGGGIGGMVGGKVSTAVGVLVLAWIAPHWEQAASVDGGKNWETNWVADFTRAG